MAVPKKSTAKEAGQEKANGSPPEFTKEQELKALRDMLLIRRFEEKAGQLYGMGAIGGFCHLYIGQEAVVVGMQMALKMGDQVITGYRDHGHMLATGMEAKGVMAELTGRRGGYSKGKGGSMHMYSMEKNFFGGHGIVGAQVSLGTGLAFANRYRGNDFVSLAYFGVNAYTGKYGLNARQELDQEIVALTSELARLKRERAEGEQRVSLLRSDRVDSDMLDERARYQLDYANPRDLVRINKPASGN